MNLENALTLHSKHYKTSLMPEEESVFKKWIFAGYLHDLKNHGDYFSTHIYNDPIMVANNNGNIVAYYNVCRHHASSLVQNKGNCSKFRCPYHGWTYDLNGNLKGTPEFEDVCNFNKEDFGLHKLEVDVFSNLVFVKKDVFDTSLNCYLGKIDIPNYSFVCRKSYNLKCNWKVYVDNYLDGGYHVNYVHKSLATAIDYKEYRNEIYDYSVLQKTPLKASDDPIINETRSGDFAYYWWIYPNLMINLYGTMMDINIVVPEKDNSCTVHMDFFTSLPSGNIQESIDVSDIVQLEDVSICENVQKGLESSVYETGRYSVRREGGMHHFHKLWMDDAK